MRVAKAVSDTPSGGQIIMSGESLADIASIKDLMNEVSVSFRPIGHRPTITMSLIISHCILKKRVPRDALAGSALDRNQAHHQAFL